MKLILQNLSFTSPGQMECPCDSQFSEGSDLFYVQISYSDYTQELELELPWEL